MMTTMNTASQAPDFSSSKSVAILLRSDAVIELGRKLVAELGSERDSDTLEQWMSYYIAELILDAENAQESQRPEKMQRCCAAILNLWKHRHELPDGKRPFENIEPILNAVRSLDPDNDIARYRFGRCRGKNDVEENDPATKWLELIDNLDISTKLLIRYCLSRAAEAALDKSKEWVALAEAAGAEEGAEHVVIRFISYESDMLKALDGESSSRKQLSDRIERLELLMEAASSLSLELQERLRVTD